MSDADAAASRPSPACERLAAAANARSPPAQPLQLRLRPAAHRRPARRDADPRLQLRLEGPARELRADGARGDGEHTGDHQRRRRVRPLDLAADRVSRAACSSSGSLRTGSAAPVAVPLVLGARSRHRPVHRLLITILRVQPVVATLVDVLRAAWASTCGSPRTPEYLGERQLDPPPRRLGRPGSRRALHARRTDPDLAPARADCRTGGRSTRSGQTTPPPSRAASTSRSCA